jgi:hypothetical protein
MPAVHAVREDCDGLARALLFMGRLAREMPPSWDGDRISIPICSPSGGCLGRALPGRGIWLNDDLKNLGIRGTLPYVYERSPVSWLVDFFRDASFDQAERAWRYAQRRHRAKPLSFVRDPELGAITGLDGIIAARGLGKGEDRIVNKNVLTTVVNAWSSLWRVGGLPTAGTYTAIPGGSAPTRSTNGAWSYGLTDPTGGDKKYLLGVGYTCTQIIQMLLVHDLLIEAGNIAMSTTGTKTITSTALTRYTNGKGVMVCGVVTTAFGTGIGAWNLLSYTDQDGNTGQVGQVCNSAASTIVERTVPNSAPFLGTYIPLAAGDYGLRAISTMTVGTAHTAGLMALEVTFPLMWIPGIIANVWVEKPAPEKLLGMQELVTTGGGVLGCLSGYVLTGATSLGTFQASLITCAG